MKPIISLKEDVPRSVGSLMLPNSWKLIFRSSDERQRVSPQSIWAKIKKLEIYIASQACVTSYSSNTYLYGQR